MRLEGLRRWLAEILWPKLHELDVICEMNRVAADVVNGEWRKDRDNDGMFLSLYESKGAWLHYEGITFVGVR